MKKAAHQHFFLLLSRRLLLQTANGRHFRLYSGSKSLRGRDVCPVKKAM